ncbi:MAG: type II toxin-antitoxin system prevent-host-death family antitoxin [Candidatus Vogelbacteria bacterium]|nr:type II toxin-antitoxin system prevent-host-death family antitoxin [Candidatus Vogelbacteria bacterium]
MTKIIGLKDLRENTDTYLNQVKKGHSFLVMRRSEPVFRISPADESEEIWERVIDFTKIKKGGVALDQILARL